MLAIPPRLIAERIRFTPPLPQALQAALLATPTWMATQAKAQLVFERKAWRELGHSGNAFVQHHQAVLREAFGETCVQRIRDLLWGEGGQPLPERLSTLLGRALDSAR